MYQPNYGGQDNQGYQPQQQTTAKPRKEIINKVELIGIIVPRSANENEQITFYPFSNGGGAVHCNMKVIQYTGRADENGQPKYRTTYVPLDINVNKLISATTLQALVSGMKVRVVGELRTQSYEKKTTRERVTSLVVSVYILEVLEAPMAAPVYQTAPQGYQQAPQPQMPGYPPQAMPAASPQPAYPPHSQTYPAAAPQYSRQPATPNAGRMPQAQPQAQPQMPGYMPQPYQPFMDDGDLPQA